QGAPGQDGQSVEIVTPAAGSSAPSALEPAYAYSEVAEVAAEQGASNPTGFHEMETVEGEVEPEETKSATTVFARSSSAPSAKPARRSALQIVSSFGPGAGGSTPSAPPAKPAMPAKTSAAPAKAAAAPVPSAQP